jgi:hypothetical protein
MNIMFYADRTVYLIFLHQKPSTGVYFTFTQEIIYASTGIYLHCMAEVEGFSYSSDGYFFSSQNHLGCLGIIQVLWTLFDYTSCFTPHSQVIQLSFSFQLHACFHVHYLSKLCKNSHVCPIMSE